MLAGRRFDSVRPQRLGLVHSGYHRLDHETSSSKYVVKVEWCPKMRSLGLPEAHKKF